MTENGGWSALEGMCLEAGATETVRWRNPLPVTALRTPRPRPSSRPRSSSAYNRSSRLTRPPTIRRRIDIHALRRHQGDRLPHVTDGSIWRFAEMTQPHDWT